MGAYGMGSSSCGIAVGFCWHFTVMVVVIEWWWCTEVVTEC